MSLIAIFSRAFFLCLLVSANAVKAEDFQIHLKPASQLKKVTELEIVLNYEPADAFEMTEELKLNISPVLFKLLDSSKNTIRVFFDPNKLQYFDEIVISGHLKRSNHTASATASIKSLSFISDFSQNIDADKVDASIVLTKKNSDEPLPYLGISSATLLGPPDRIFSPQMFIAIGDLETYGFDFSRGLQQIMINGVEAKLISSKIVAATLELDKMPKNNSLDLELQIIVNEQLVKKSVGTISLKEPL